MLMPELLVVLVMRAPIAEAQGLPLGCKRP